jgi:hypothetical protein
MNRTPPHDHPHTHSDPLLFAVTAGLIVTDIAIVVILLLLAFGGAW